MGKLAFALTLLLLNGCAAKQIVRPREVIRHAATHDTTVLLSRQWLPDGSVLYAMEVSFLSEEFLAVKAGQNLDLFIDGHRYRLASPGDSVRQASTHSRNAESLIYDGLPPEFIARLGHAGAVKGTITGPKSTWDFEFTKVLLQQFHDWAE